MKKYLIPILFFIPLFANAFSFSDQYNLYIDKIVKSIEQKYQEYFNPSPSDQTSNLTSNLNFGSSQNQAVSGQSMPGSENMSSGNNSLSSLLSNVTSPNNSNSSSNSGGANPNDSNLYLPPEFANQYIEQASFLSNPTPSPKPDSSLSGSSQIQALNCKGNSIEGSGDSILGCGRASTFGSTTTGNKEQDTDDGNTYCNTKNEDKFFTYKSNRSKDINTSVKVAALKIKDIQRIFKTKITNRKAWCGKKLIVIDKNTGKKVEVTLYDIMNDNSPAVIDLSGGAMRELNGTSKEEPTLYNVVIQTPVTDDSNKTIQTASLKN